MRVSFYVVLAGLVATPALAADEKPQAKVIAEIARCRSVTADTERLACMDRAAAALVEATEQRTIVVLDRQEVQRTRRSLFGFTLPKLPFFGNDRNDDDKEPRAEAVTQLDTTIERASPTGYGLYTLVLAEGGTWRTTEADRSVSPASGGKISIKRGPLGNYLATFGGRRALRINRIN